MHGEFGADQIEAFGPHMTAEQAQAGDLDLRLGCARHHRAVGIAHDDVADADRGAAILGPLDLGAADFDALAAAEIVGNGGGEPGGEGVELDRSAGQPPPQAGEAQDQNAGQDAGADPDLADQAAMAGEQAAIGSEVPPVAAERPPRWAAVRLPRRRGCTSGSHFGPAALCLS